MAIEFRDVKTRRANKLACILCPVLNTCPLWEERSEPWRSKDKKLKCPEKKWDKPLLPREVSRARYQVCMSCAEFEPIQPCEGILSHCNLLNLDDPWDQDKRDAKCPLDKWDDL